MDRTLADDDISTLLRDAWRIDGGDVTPIQGGTVNDAHIVTDGGRRCVLRVSPVERTPAHVHTELTMVRELTRRGFPTPDIILTTEGALTATIGGRIATLFDFIDGTTPPSRTGGYGSLDVALGASVIQLAARMHIVLKGVQLSASRTIDPTPHDLLSPSASERATNAVVAGLESFHDAREDSAARVLQTLHDHGSDLPSGFIHADLSETNLIRDRDDQLWLIDFDDCLISFLGYDLCSCISFFGMDESRLLDLDRTRTLLAAYDAIRPRSSVERTALPTLLLAWFGSQAAHVVRGIVSRGSGDVLDSYSAAAFLDLHARFDDISAALSEER